MAQPKILLTRIDDRFIYAQDIEQWNETVGSNLVLIVNDGIAADSRKWAPMRVAAPEGVWTIWEIPALRNILCEQRGVFSATLSSIKSRKR